MERDYSEEERFLRAEKRVKEIKGFYWHLFWYMAVNIFLWTMIIINLNQNESFFQYGHFATAFFWGIGIGFHGLGIFGKNNVFFKEWENRKIKEIMEKDESEFHENRS